jgi:hypothetical protein
MSIITEVKNIKIDHECKDFPIYLTWLNGLGGYDSWLFFKEHTVSTKTKVSNKYNINVQDLENAIATNDITGKDVAPQMKIGGRIEAADMDGMQSLYESPKVMMLSNPETWETDGAKWKRVIVKTGSLLTLKTRTAYLEVKLTLELPYIFKQKE